MADLTEVLPNFDLEPWKHLTYSLGKKNILTAELIAIDPLELVKRCPLPLKEVRRMAAAVTDALNADLSVVSIPPPPRPQANGEMPPSRKSQFASRSKLDSVQYVKTLDPAIDECLAGGFPTGQITEIVGESAVGKTQFVLSLLLSAQLLPPCGLGRSVVYLSTESNLNTIRLVQILKSHPEYLQLSPKQRPSLDRILTIATHDVEAQEHIIQFQLPETVKRYNVGLIVVDSVAANFRVEFQGSSRKVLAERAVSLVRLGTVLRKIAHDQNVAIVVTNQVADRFDDARTTADKLRLSSQAPSSSASSYRQTQSKTQPSTQIHPARDNPSLVNNIPGQTSPAESTRNNRVVTQNRDEIMSLDFQQRFFTGWGHDPRNPFEPQKTPALGLTWAKQIDARIALKMDHNSTHAASDTGNIWSDVKRKRFLSVVFAPWARPTVVPVQYTLEMQGPVSVPHESGHSIAQIEDFDGIITGEECDVNNENEENAELLDPKWWGDDNDDDEFP